jgi:hypothetical protein
MNWGRASHQLVRHITRTLKIELAGVAIGPAGVTLYLVAGTAWNRQRTLKRPLGPINALLSSL